jgi:hypothetical protein
MDMGGIPMVPKRCWTYTLPGKRNMHQETTY